MVNVCELLSVAMSTFEPQREAVQEDLHGAAESDTYCIIGARLDI